MAFFDDWTLAELKGFRKELSSALVSGTMRVRFADREVQYSTQADQRAALGLIDREITKREGGTAAPRRIRMATRTGWR
jgi:hypothetical protein